MFCILAFIIDIPQVSQSLKCEERDADRNSPVQARYVKVQSGRQNFGQGVVDEVEIFEEHQGKQRQQNSCRQYALWMLCLCNELRKEESHHRHGQKNQGIDGFPLSVKQIARKQQVQVPAFRVLCRYGIVKQKDEGV